MRGIDINDFYTTSIPINRHNIIMLIKIQKSEKYEPQSLLFQLKQQTLWLVFLLIIAILINSNKLYYSAFYLVNLLLDYSTIPCGFDIRP